LTWNYKIISKSWLRFQEEPEAFKLGDPISVRVCIETSNAWSQRSEFDPVTMMYDIIADKEGWLVAGPKRGSYLADVSRSQRFLFPSIVA
jgi:hypothetical protein